MKLPFRDKPSFVMYLLINLHYRSFFQVSSKEVNKFHLAYVSVLRANMDNLERRKKTDCKTKATVL
uniref:Ovule protein n=1 Tax=Angiostrongylus cantonensis TaxID=6313 RepID=A0A0K0DRJ8_ANGCA